MNNKKFDFGEHNAKLSTITSAGALHKPSKEDFTTFSNQDLWKRNFVPSTVVEVPTNLMNLRIKDSCYIGFHQPRSKKA